jgi:hypothetical protein
VLPKPTASRSPGLDLHEIRKLEDKCTIWQEGKEDNTGQVQFESKSVRIKMARTAGKGVEGEANNNDDRKTE